MQLKRAAKSCENPPICIGVAKQMVLSAIPPLLPRRMPCRALRQGPLCSQRNRMRMVLTPRDPPLRIVCVRATDPLNLIEVFKRVRHAGHDRVLGVHPSLIHRRHIPRRHTEQRTNRIEDRLDAVDHCINSTDNQIDTTLHNRQDAVEESPDAVTLRRERWTDRGTHRSLRRLRRHVRQLLDRIRGRRVPHIRPIGDTELRGVVVIARC